MQAGNQTARKYKSERADNRLTKLYNGIENLQIEEVKRNESKHLER